MVDDGCVPRELSRLVVPQRGSLEATGDLFAPFRLVDGDGVVVGAAAVFFAELSACGRPATTQRSYGMDLLRWFRFVGAVGVSWDEATRAEARDFCRWLQVADKPVRPHWRYPGGDAPGAAAREKAGHGDGRRAATVSRGNQRCRRRTNQRTNGGDRFTQRRLHPWEWYRHVHRDAHWCKWSGGSRRVRQRL